MNREHLALKAAILTLVLLSAVTGRVAWEVERGNPVSFNLPGLFASAQAQQQCTPVQTFTGTGNQTTPVFNITGDSFRISYTTTAGTVTGDGSQGVVFDVTVYDENDEFITSASQERAGSDSTFVNEGPGRFYLEIFSANAEWSVEVEDCTGRGRGSESLSPASPQYDQYTTVTPVQTPERHQYRQPDRLLEAGGPGDGPVPAMPGGGCPAEFPLERGGLCYAG
ncbi:hypothetical protein E0L93_08560 [Rubrobacter taiwanensis]|uniref:Uncharacterized protein n=1 Tax=Rubrobacter taiwanensis TaxID=185139 RepID=A0A4R1BHK5_9ACTN|nr:hypothetical protein [Rubrobacter taiwanensis]TCJ16766.1 hypothetical protein E0L93_08560 [Rubrobacter taiwanensis]